MNGVADLSIQRYLGNLPIRATFCAPASSAETSSLLTFVPMDLVRKAA